MDRLLNLVGSEALWSGLWGIALQVDLPKLMTWLVIATIAFKKAEKSHREEVAKQFKILASAIERAAETFTSGMKRVDGLEKRVEKLEQD